MARPTSPNEPALAASQPLPSRPIGRRTLLAGGAAAIGGAWVHRAAEALSQISGAAAGVQLPNPTSVQGTPPSALGVRELGRWPTLKEPRI